MPAVIDTVSSLGRAAGAPMLSHDDSQIETRDYFRSQGARISEFPMNRRVALAAREAGDMIVFGAPNAARGGSHLGNSPGVAQMVREGLCDILASDYYYPAMLIGLARLVADGAGNLPSLWPLVSGNPADALALRIGVRSPWASAPISCWSSGRMRARPSSAAPGLPAAWPIRQYLPHECRMRKRQGLAWPCH